MKINNLIYLTLILFGNIRASANPLEILIDKLFNENKKFIFVDINKNTLKTEASFIDIKYPQDKQSKKRLKTLNFDFTCLPSQEDIKETETNKDLISNAYSFAQKNGKKFSRNYFFNTIYAVDAGKYGYLIRHNNNYYGEEYFFNSHPIWFTGSDGKDYEIMAEDIKNFKKAK